MPEAEQKLLATPGEMLLAGVSLACWIAAVPLVLIGEFGAGTPSLARLAAYSRPVVSLALPIGVGSLTLLLLRRPARSPGWRVFQWAMLALSALGLVGAVVSLAG